MDAFIGADRHRAADFCQYIVFYSRQRLFDEGDFEFRGNSHVALDIVFIHPSFASTMIFASGAPRTDGANAVEPRHPAFPFDFQQRAVAFSLVFAAMVSASASEIV